MFSDSPRVRSRLDLLHEATRSFNVGLDLDRVLNNILTVTLAAMGVSEACLCLFDPAGKPNHFFTVTNFKIEEHPPADIPVESQNTLRDWVKTHRRPLIINTTDHWFWAGFSPQLQPGKSTVVAPIFHPDYLLGTLIITANQPDYFDQSDLIMLEILADQAAFSITNAQLFKAERRRRQLADTFTSIARTINSTLNLNEVLNLILEQLALVIDYDSSSILLYNEETETMSVRAGRRFDDMEDALHVTIPIVESSPNYQAIVQKKPAIIGDVDQVPGWLKSPSTQAVRSWIGAPLIARDRVIGMLTIDSHDVNKYTQENADDVATFADYVATAVANAQIVSRLKSTEASYTALFEDSTDMAIITNYQGLILNVNRKTCQLLRRAKEALIGGDIRFIHPQLGDVLTEQARRLRVWREAAIELDVQDAYRQVISLELRMRQVHYAGKNCVQWAGRDISARKEAEQLRQDLVNMLIHDLRGPIGNLINTIELLPMLFASTTDMTTINRLLDLARQTGQEVRDLVDSLLDVSRLEKGDVPLQRDEWQIADIVQAAEKQVAARAAAKSIFLKVAPLPPLTPAWIDGSMIRRILINLLDNAVKYTPPEGQVWLTTTHTAAAVTFAVADTGPGIKPEYQPQIFNKFSRVDYSSQAPPGVGLGLAFCKLAAEAHHGTVTVESTGIPGEGSTFYLSLPLAPKPGL